ncbi:hypothetical protein [Butyrivibrio sp. XPD2006]|uniref:hypothetical protein n=1 Tax=Butyrivibrio sp. XPD2006 TaxID=1280668 RepID=UPI0003B77345|nr:hypothetical protein [Butyrivibrio sp. XPD2006]
MRKKSIVGLVMTIALMAVVGCSGGTAQNHTPEGVDLKPVIYLYPQEDGSEISVSLDYNGDITDLIPEFNAENTWNVTADRDGKITFEGNEYDYLFWEGVPRFEYDFYTGYCVKGEETEGFLREKLAEQGLNESEIDEFLKFWLADMEGNPYNVISFQGKTYNKGARLTVTPEPDNLIRVFMAWYPSDHHIRIMPQILDTPSRDGFTVVEWGGNKVK